jgi:hypothetical protein
MFSGISARIRVAAKTLAEIGYTNIYNYSDGFFKWRDADLPVRLSDEYPGSMLFSKPVEVAPGIWSAIGATAPPRYENSGHNNNLSFIITSDGAVVIAHEGTDLEIEAHSHASIRRMLNRQRDKAMCTKLTRPDITFEDRYIIELGGERIELLNLGPAHSP